MKKKIFARNIIIAGIAVFFIFSNTVWAYWIWTPGTKKFINPKNAVKDSPKEQFDWAMTFYNTKDYQRAAAEFDKLTKQYEYSEYASKAQYYEGLCYENMNKFYIAFQNYQKAIDNFPHIENMDEIVAREFNIANMFAVKESPKVLGTDILTSLDRSIEIYKKVVDNAPYGRLADEAQYSMGVAMKKAERYDEAIQAFQKILDDYPTSTFVDKSKFEVADCAYKASLKPAYDVAPTARAIKAFEDFSHENRDKSLSKEADKTIQRLKDKAAEKSLMTAQFYEKQGRYRAAIIYYKDVIDTYPESSFVNQARSKIESLTARLERPKAAPFAFLKPAAKPVETPAGAEAPKAKGWNPLGFMKPAKPKEAVSETTTAKKGLWPFNLGKPAKPKEVTVQRATSKDRWGWSPLSLFTKPAKPKETAPEAATERKVSKAKSWTPLSFTNPAKPAKPKEVMPQGATSKERWGWNPFGFTKPAKPKEVTTQEASKDKSGWKPLSFTKAKKSSGEMTVAEVKTEDKAAPAATQSTAVGTVPQNSTETKVEEPKVETTEEKTAAPAATEPMAQSEVKVTAEEAQTSTDDNTDDQIEKSEY